MQTAPRRIRKRRLRTRSGNPLSCLLCYVIAFAVPVLWQAAALRFVYPYRLAATAPDFAAILINDFPFLNKWLAPAAALTAEGSAAVRDVMAAREQVWLFSLAAFAAAVWAFVLLVQLLWRFTHRRPLLSARQTGRAIRSYHFMMLFIWALCLASAAFLWHFGVRHIPGRTLWDYLVSFGVYALIPLPAAFVSRFAASGAISGRHAFFKRI